MHAPPRLSACQAIHLVMPDGLGTGTPVIQHGRHGDPHSDGIALVAECGQHFLQATGELAVEVALRFIAHFGLIDADPGWACPAPPRRYELLSTEVVQDGRVQFSRPVVGMETFARGELIASDGEREIRSPCDDCTIFMPTRKAVVGRELVYLTRPLP
jgi:hypothetical protein